MSREVTRYAYMHGGTHVKCVIAYKLPWSERPVLPELMSSVLPFTTVPDSQVDVRLYALFPGSTPMIMNPHCPIVKACGHSHWCPSDAANCGLDDAFTYS